MRQRAGKAPTGTSRQPLAALLLLLVPLLLGLGLRLLAWRWRELYPLGGDESEYLQQAITLLRDYRYVELQLMRPPLYTLFLAASIYLVDSLVQNLRLVQALISTATIAIVFLLGRELARWHEAARKERVALLATTLAALSYTLAVNASELLSETLFLAGLTLFFWLLLRAGRLGGWRVAAAAGLVLGGLCLVRSVALPLLPLGALWLFANAAAKPRTAQWLAPALAQSCALILAACVLILPWTARNYANYGGLILIDTTGAENLWLDNDPAGREAVKAQLYAMGDDRLARQQRATRAGLAAIGADPGRFARKVGGELLRFFALEFSDDMLARRAIWVPPAEVALRLLLGDGLWLLLLLAGGYGLARRGLAAIAGAGGPPGAALALFRSPAGLLGLWALYLLLTTLIFHVELRYRLPLYPVLLGYSALVLVGNGGRTSEAGERGPRPRALGLAWLVPFMFCGLTFLHAPYLALATNLALKHWQLGRAEAALLQGDQTTAVSAARAALDRDPDSVLARVALARTALRNNDPAAARAWLDQAIAALPAHPQAHLLRGDLLRAGGDEAAARAELVAYEAGSLQDLQGWSWDTFITPPPARLDLGGGLDLGFVRGFHPPAEGETGWRWTRGQAQLRLSAAAGSDELRLRMASGRPDGSAVRLELLLDGRPLAQLDVGAAWQEYSLELPANSGSGELVLTLTSPTFTPRQYDRASPDGRTLGVKVDTVELR